MNRGRRIAVALAALGSLATATAGLAQPRARETYGLGLAGVVPVICSATVSAGVATAGPGRTPIGRLNILCNDPAGYQVWVDYPPALAMGSVVLDGRQIPMSAAGKTLILASPTAGRAAYDLAIEAASAVDVRQINIRIVAF